MSNTIASRIHRKVVRRLSRGEQLALQALLYKAIEKAICPPK